MGDKSLTEPVDILEKYKESFKKSADKELNEETVSAVDKCFENLKRTIEFFKNFHMVGKWNSKLWKQNAVDYGTFVKSAVGDYKRKLTVQDQEKALAKYNQFVC